MRWRLLVIVVSLIFVFVACTKKSKYSQHDYACVKYDSVYSNIPALCNPKYDSVHFFYGHVTSDQVNFFIKSHANSDTLYYSNDTLEMEYWSVKCELYEY